MMYGSFYKAVMQKICNVNLQVLGAVGSYLVWTGGNLRVYYVHIIFVRKRLVVLPDNVSSLYRPQPLL